MVFLCIFSNTLERNTSTDLIYITKTSEKNFFLPDVFIVNSIEPHQLHSVYFQWRNVSHLKKTDIYISRDVSSTCFYVFRCCRRVSAKLYFNSILRCCR